MLGHRHVHRCYTVISQAVINQVKWPSRLRDLRLVRCVACFSLSSTRVPAALGWSTLIVTDMAIGRIRRLLVTRHVIGWGYGNHSRRVFGVTAWSDWSVTGFVTGQRCGSLATRTILGQGLEWNLRDASSRTVIGQTYAICLRGMLLGRPLRDFSDVQSWLIRCNRYNGNHWSDVHFTCYTECYCS